MPLWEGFKIALTAIWAHKLRAFLTALGILMGVTTVIAMLSIVGGVNQQVVSELNSIGVNVFYVQKFPALMISTNRRKWASRQDLDMEQAREIRRRCPAVAEVSPYHWTQAKQVRFRNRKTNPDVVVVGAVETFLEVATETLQDGRFFTALDVSRNRPVCVIGVDVVNELFPFSDPIGQEVRIQGHRYTVIGTLAERGSIFGQSRDNEAIIPIGLFERQMGRHDKRNYSIAVRVRPDVPAYKAISQVRAALRAIRNVPFLEEDNFVIETRDSIMDAYTNITGAIFAAAIGIAFISLLVGGIGIMNIMLVSVRERTREIGVRMAMGAKRRDVLVQFLIEAVTVSAIGGVLGVLLGIVGLRIAAGVYPDLPVQINSSAVILAFGFSVGAGVFFGVYPARKAAQLDPIECLRYE